MLKFTESIGKNTSLVLPHRLFPFNIKKSKIPDKNIRTFKDPISMEKRMKNIKGLI
jgi:hypothetical protein